MTMTKFQLTDEMFAAPARAMRESPCPACKKPVLVDADCLWVQDEGVFHPDCVEKVEGKEAG